MAIPVYLEKRTLKSKKRNGQHNYRWALRWLDVAENKFKCETTGTADRTAAEALQKLKWAEVNGLAAPRQQPEPQPLVAGPTWKEASEALERAMQADNMRPSYVADAVLMFDGLQAAFPEITSPSEITMDMANEYKRRRSEAGVSPWTLRGDLSTLKAVFGKWLGRECGLLTDNPFANVKAPRCDDPEVRIVSAAETADLVRWLGERWNNWRLPVVFLEVAAMLGWRATEIASLRAEDLLADGFVRVTAESSKTRRHKYGWLPVELHQRLRECMADGWAFGRFSGELQRLLLLWRKQPHHAAKIRGFSPERLVGWLQDELQRYHAGLQASENEAAKEEERVPRTFDTFTLHDFRRTAITGMQMAGVSEKEASIMVGATPEVIRRHYEKMDQQAIARRNVERRLTVEGRLPEHSPQTLRASYARPLDNQGSVTQVESA